MSSIDNITSESIQCLAFVDSFAKKGGELLSLFIFGHFLIKRLTDFSIWPTLWVGTSLGSILVISISLPNGGKEARKNDHVAASPSGTIFRIKGPILLMSFLDWTGQVVQGSFEAWRDESREVSRTGNP
jgi:syntaxin-binding protein 5